MDDGLRLERDHEREIRNDKKEWYKALGLDGKDGAEYRQWIMQQGGPDIYKAKDEDEANGIESKYPIHKMLDEQAKEKQAQEIETAKQKSAAEEHGRYEEKQREQKEDQGAGTSDNPLGLNLGQ